MPTGSQSTDELIELIRSGAMLGGGTIFDGTAGIDLMAEVLKDKVDPEFVTLMVSESAGAVESRGIAGFREALGDWISPYEAFRLEIEDVIVNDDKLIFLARQVATTKHDGVEVKTESASVWWVKDGLIRQAAFYLDRSAGLKAAGVDPGRQPGD
jgi:ketosteroid isomerase-like protein